MDRASGTWRVSISHSGFGHNALNFHRRMPRLRFDTMSSSESHLTIHRSEVSGEAVMPRWIPEPQGAKKCEQYELPEAESRSPIISFDHFRFFRPSPVP